MSRFYSITFLVILGLTLRIRFSCHHLMFYRTCAHFTCAIYFHSFIEKLNSTNSLLQHSSNESNKIQYNHRYCLDVNETKINASCTMCNVLVHSCQSLFFTSRWWCRRSSQAPKFVGVFIFYKHIVHINAYIGIHTTHHMDHA